jgi:hypothetical protein
MHPIPGLVRGVDSAIPRQVLESKLKVIDKRRAEIEALLAHASADSYQAQELKAERAGLGAMRHDIDAVLNPKPVPPRSPELEKAYAEQRARDVALLRITIKQRTEQIEHAAEKEEAAGNHRSARMHRLTIPDIPTQICAEYGKDVGLLAELDKPRGGGVPRRRSA